MPKGFPTCSCKKIKGIVEKHAEFLRSNGSHATYRSNKTGRNFTFPIRKKDFKTGTVKKILVKDLGLTEEEALKEVQ